MANESGAMTSPTDSGQQIPLWDGSVLSLPPQLEQVYKTQLRWVGLYDQVASGEQPGRGPVGGADQNAAEEHFAHRFPGSAARLEYLTLDPDTALGAVAGDLLASFGDGHVAVLDIPCGSGAAVLSMMATLAQMRQRNQVPSLPLNVDIVGGDFSSRSLEICERNAAQLHPWLAKFGIQTTFASQQWDASREDHTARIVDSWFASAASAEEYFVLISAFSGTGANRFKEFERTFSHVSARLYDKRSTMLWVEPTTNKARSFLDKVGQLFARIPGFKSLGNGDETKTFNWRHPITSTIQTGHISVQRYTRG